MGRSKRPDDDHRGSALKTVFSPCLRPGGRVVFEKIAQLTAAATDKSA